MPIRVRDTGEIQNRKSFKEILESHLDKHNLLDYRGEFGKELRELSEEDVDNLLEDLCGSVKDSLQIAFNNGKNEITEYNESVNNKLQAENRELHSELRSATDRMCKLEDDLVLAKSNNANSRLEKKLAKTNRVNKKLKALLKELLEEV